MSQLLFFQDLRPYLIKQKPDKLTPKLNSLFGLIAYRCEGKQGFCNMKNETFLTDISSPYYGKQKRAVQKGIEKLRDAGLILVEYKNKKRQGRSIKLTNRGLEYREESLRLRELKKIETQSKGKRTPSRHSETHTEKTKRHPKTHPLDKTILTSSKKTVLTTPHLVEKSEQIQDPVILTKIQSQRKRMDKTERQAEIDRKAKEHLDSSERYWASDAGKMRIRAEREAEEYLRNERRERGAFNSAQEEREYLAAKKEKEAAEHLEGRHLTWLALGGTEEGWQESLKKKAV